MASKEKWKIAVIIPTVNEEKNIGALSKGILEQGFDTEIVFVDDNSRDSTRKIVEEMMKKSKKVHLIEREKKMGLGSAYVAGMKYALANLDSALIFTMDADLSHNPKDIPRLVEKINEGADIVIGSRYAKGGKIIGWGIYRTIISMGANLLARIILGLKAKDLTNGFRCYKRKVLEKINLNEIKATGYCALHEFIFFAKRKGFKTEEIPTTFVNRIGGESKFSQNEIFLFLLNIIRLRLTK